MAKISLFILILAVVLAVVLAVIVAGALEMGRAATIDLDTWFYARVLDQPAGAVQTTGEITSQTVEINRSLPDAWLDK